MSSAPPGRRTATWAAALGMAALAASGVPLTTGPATAAPGPKASPAALAAQSAAGLVASRATVLHAGKDDAFTAHSVISTREGLQYVPYDRTYKGLPVYGGDFVVVTDSTGRVLSTTTAQHKTINVATTATQTAAQAAATARARAKGKAIDSVSTARKVVLALGTPRLAYETVVSSHAGATPSKLHVFTDARTGVVAYSYDEVRDGSGTGKWNGPNPLSIDTSHPTSTSWTMTDPTRPNVSCRNYSSGAVLSGSDDVWGNGVGSDIETGCVDALFDLKTEWTMLSTWLGRNGINGSGGGFPIQVGLNDVNAFWDGTKVAVGHNNAGDWISSLDVVGHEFGHAIDNNTPGGIGSSSVAEFTGDVFGVLTERFANEPTTYDEPDYTVGEEINLVGQGPIRNMYNPSLKGDPNCYSSAIPTTETHSAAGPGNHWFYLASEGSSPTNGQPTSPTCNGSTVTGIGITTVGKIFYNAMLSKTTGMTYLQYRTATLNAAKNLYPGNCANFNVIKAAWDAVSVPAQTGDPTCTTTGATVGNVAVNGGFESGQGSWTAMPGTNYVAYQSGQVSGESAHSGQYYGATNTGQSGGGIYQDVPVTTVAGNVYCASAWVRTQYPSTGASGTFALWLLGGTSTESGSAGFSGLSNGTGWQQVQTCVSATTSHALMRIQFYPDVNSSTLEIDDIDVHASMAVNGGFESGQGSWTAMPGTNYVAYQSGQIAGESARSGQYYGATNTGQSGGGIYQDLPVSTVAGNVYCASAWVRTPYPATGASGQFVMWLLGGSSAESGAVDFTGLSNGGDWRQVQTCVSATTSHTQLRIQFYPTVNGPTVEIDDIDVHASLAVNGGFESGQGSWAAMPGTNYVAYQSAQIPGESARSGQYYGATNTSQPGGGIYQDLPVTTVAGNVYCASAWVQTQGSTGASGTFRLWLLGGNSTETAGVDFQANTTDWQQVQTCVSATTNHSQLRIQFYPNVNTPTLEIDDIDVH